MYYRLFKNDLRNFISLDIRNKVFYVLSFRLNRFLLLINYSLLGILLLYRIWYYVVLCRIF